MGPFPAKMRFWDEDPFFKNAFGMRTLSSKERVLPQTPSPKEQRALAGCEQLFAGRLLRSTCVNRRAIDFQAPPFLRGELLFFKKKRTSLVHPQEKKCNARLLGEKQSIAGCPTSPTPTKAKLALPIVNPICSHDTRIT